MKNSTASLQQNVVGFKFSYLPQIVLINKYNPDYVNLCISCIYVLEATVYSLAVSCHFHFDLGGQIYQFKSKLTSKRDNFVKFVGKRLFHDSILFDKS